MVDDEVDGVENAWTTNVLLLGRPLFHSSAAAATSSDVKHGELFVIMVGCFCGQRCHFFLFCQTGFDTTMTSSFIRCVEVEMASEVGGRHALGTPPPPHDWQFHSVGSYLYVCSSLRLDRALWR